VADRLHAKYGSFLSCKSCSSSERDRKGNYIKNVAGKRDGEDRYYRRWCCTTNGKFSCPSLSNASYIDWAKTQLSRDTFHLVVETIRGGFEDKGPEHCRLGLLLLDGPSRLTETVSLKRKATTVQATPPPTKRRLDFFGTRDVVLPSTDKTSCRKDEGAYVTPAPSTLNAEKADLVHSPPLGLIADLVDIRARLDDFIAAWGDIDVSSQQEDKHADCDKTRENSLSPEEYLGTYQTNDLALHTTAGLITTPDPSSPLRPQSTCAGASTEISSPSTNDIDAVDASLPGVERVLPPISRAAILAADFHSADIPKRKEIRTRAKRENVVAAFEEEVRRIGALAKALT
jgi:hypothetical protein